MLIREVSVVYQFVTCSLWAEAGIVGVWEVIRRREPASSALFLGVPPGTLKAKILRTILRGVLGVVPVTSDSDLTSCLQHLLRLKENPFPSSDVGPDS